MWQAMRQTAYNFADAIDKEGGNASVVDLPKEGIEGNTHFMFQDKNSDEIAVHIEDWLKENVE